MQSTEQQIEKNELFIVCLKDSGTDHSKRPDGKSFKEALIKEFDRKLTVELVAKLIRDYLIFRDSTVKSEFEKFFSKDEKSNFEKLALVRSSKLHSAKSPLVQFSVAPGSDKWLRVLKDYPQLINITQEYWDRIMYDKSAKNEGENLVKKIRDALGIELIVNLKETFKEGSLKDLNEVSSPGFLTNLKTELDKELTPLLLKTVREKLNSTLSDDHIIKQIRENLAAVLTDNSIQEEFKLPKDIMDQLKSPSYLGGELSGALIEELILLWEQILDHKIYEERKKWRKGKSKQANKCISVHPLFSDKELSKYENGQAYERLTPSRKAIYRMFEVGIHSDLNLRALQELIENVKDEAEFVELEEHQTFLAKPLIKNEEVFIDLLEHHYPFKLINCEDLSENTVLMNKLKGSNEGDAAKVIIAVIDSGFDYHHPTYSFRLVKKGKNFFHRMQGSGTNSIDPNEVSDYDSYFGQGDSAQEIELPDASRSLRNGFGHGTHIIGIIESMYRVIAGKETSESQKKPVIQVIPYKVFPEAAKCNIIRATIDAANLVNDETKVVINNSWGPSRRRTRSRSYECALNYIKDKFENKVIPVFSAGNSNDDVRFYAPANSEQVISVAAVNKAAKKTKFSNYGSGVDIAAPGKYIWSTVPVTNHQQPNNGPYIHKDGTSMATPFVSLTIALLLLGTPGLSVKTIRKILEKSGTTLEGEKMEFRLLNVARALTELELDPDTNRQQA